MVDSPGFDYESGSRQFVLAVYANDSYFLINSTFTVVITDVNEPPVFWNLPADATEMELFTGDLFTVNATDYDDGDVVTVTIATSPSTNSPFAYDSGSGT